MDNKGDDWPTNYTSFLCVNRVKTSRSDLPSQRTHEAMTDISKSPYLCLLLSQIVPSAVMEMLRAPGPGQWWEVAQGASKSEGGCIKQVCVRACVRVWECCECVGVRVCVCVCKSASSGRPSALPLMCNGRHWDWLDQSRLLLVTRSAPTPHCTHRDERPSQTLTSSISGKESTKTPPPIGNAFIPYKCILYLSMNAAETGIFCLPFSEVKLWHVLLSCVWGGSAGPLCTMGPLWGVPISMMLRGSPLGGRLIPSLQTEANFSLHHDLLELQILV